MTEARYDRAPGERQRAEKCKRRLHRRFLVYTTGLFLAVLLTATSFWAANTSLIWPGGVVLGLAVLAIAQMGVHLVFFLHITTGPESTNNVLALAFGVLIVFVVVAGTMWIVADMNANMMLPSDAPMSKEDAALSIRATCGTKRYRPAHAIPTNASQNQQGHPRDRFAEAVEGIAASHDTGAAP